jgi:hypothetical protein
MLQYSPKIVTDSLVMCLDASQNKSYPTDLPVKNGLALWLDAADDTTFSYSSGNIVSQWRDKSGNNSHVSQATSANQPSRSTTQNSRKILTFDGTNDSLSTSISLDLSVTHTIFAIASQTTGTEDAGLVSINNSLNNGLTLHNGSTYYAYYGDGGKYATSAITTSTTYIFTKVFKGTSSTTRQVYLNGTSATTTGVIANSDASGVIRLGQQSTYLNGKIAEVIIFNRELTATELKQVHTYLGQKWGISNTDRSIIDLAGNDDNGLFGNGTVANMPAYDFYNKGTLRFDGSNDYVFLSNSQLNISSTITVEVWVKYNAQGGYNARAYSVITCKGYPWTWLLEDQSGQFNFRISTSVYSDSNVNSSYSHGLNTWNHVVGTYDGVTQKIYVDGVLRNSVALNGTINTSSNDALVGLYNYGDYCLTGNVGAVRVYNKALSATEISQNYEAQKSKFANTIVQSGLVLNLDAGNNYSYAGAGTTWYDVSGASSAAEFVGGPAFSSVDNGTIYFDGGTAYCAITPSNNFAWTPSGIGLNNMSIDIWIKTSDSAGGQMILSKPWNGSGEYNYTLYHNGFTIVTGNQTNSLGFSSIATGNWTNLVILVSTTQFGAYVNGVQVYALTNHGITNNTPTYGNTQTQLTLMTLYPYGAGGNSGFSVQGNVSSLKMYNKVLSAAEILQNYNATKGRFGL